MTRPIASVPGGVVLAAVPSSGHALVAGELAGDVDPWILAGVGGVPRVADEHRYLGLFGQSFYAQSSAKIAPDSLGVFVILHQMVQSRERVRLTAAELRNRESAPAPH